MFPFITALKSEYNQICTEGHEIIEFSAIVAADVMPAEQATLAEADRGEQVWHLSREARLHMRFFIFKTRR